MQTKQPVVQMDIRIGSSVRCRDGHGGRVIKLVVEPGSDRVTDAVVERGPLLHHDVVVPISCIARVEGDTVELDLGIEELNAMPMYAEVNFVTADAEPAQTPGHVSGSMISRLLNYVLATGVMLSPAWTGFMDVTHFDVGVPGTEVAVGRGTHVSCRDGALGRVDHVLVDPDTSRVCSLVVRKGRLLPKDFIVPSGWVKSVSENEIVLAADCKMLERLPEYRPATTDLTDPPASSPGVRRDAGE